MNLRFKTTFASVVGMELLQNRNSIWGEPFNAKTAKAILVNQPENPVPNTADFRLSLGERGRTPGVNVK